ncbi:hypothetical protein PTSG_12943 [Salpingoeca rosetta]|uniref:Sulfotransferase domain-containing protein n=1 Tax=Salpingoeca rosetta (strain ATCC 50818 / BSB-021) TaxID=946362 RepID=F2UND3_SALR5|nr:uncharacterized protein PTSG_12943 [Salpingoeca rosetta]EGD79138.1 hypothetical protein PTSG_12943 [Salpingoeca rosetta]|eukprot:XP_004989223.1 hypothetical protein PTSG_12943 [Salpingoeca rosetta]
MKREINSNSWASVVLVAAVAVAVGAAGTLGNDMPCQPSGTGSGREYTSDRHPRVLSKIGLDAEDAAEAFHVSDVQALEKNIRSCIQESAEHTSAPSSFRADQRPVHFFVISYGGSGSKTFWHFLRKYGKSYHIHDPHPVEELHMPAPTHTDTAMSVSKHKIPTADLHLFRVIVQVRDPCEAACSHLHLGLNKNHCRNMLNSKSHCLNGPQSYEEYVQRGEDHIGFDRFYQAWMDPEKAKQRNYNIVILNFHKMWDHKEEVIRALGLPPSAINDFPTSSAASEEERAKVKASCPHDGLYKIYKNVTDDIYFRLPAVSYLGPGPFP